MKILVGLLLVGSAGAQGALCARVRAMTQEPAVAAAHWGVSVARLDGTSVCAVNDAQLFRPASNNKVFTTAAAMALLGADRRFETRVEGLLDPVTGVVGNLRLIGGGDANLDSNDLPYLPAAQRPKVPAPSRFRDLEDLAAQLVARGVKGVSGEVVGDDTLFPQEPYPPSWNADDFVWGYGAPVSALTVANNQLRLTVTPGKAGEPATIALDQHGVDYYDVQEAVETLAAKAVAGFTVERVPGRTRTLRVFGTIAEGAGTDTEQIAIDNPALYAAMAFKMVLMAQGISVPGQAGVQHRPERSGVGFLERLRAPGGAEAEIAAGKSEVKSCPWFSGFRGALLAKHFSADLQADVVLTNKVSQNLHAELLLHQLGWRSVCAGDGYGVEGARMVRAFLLHAGVKDGDFLLYDGSGLSDHDLVTPRAFTTFLSYAAKQTWFAAWKSSLPEGGVDGTLNSRFPGLKGRIFAKTGTLGESRALSGYVTTSAGEVLVFSVLVDTHLPGSADRVVMDRIVAALAE